MDSFFLPLVTAALAEQGDRTQLLAMLLAARFDRPVAVFAGVALAATLNSLLAAFGGALVGGLLTHEAALLFLALGFAFAGAGALISWRDPDTGLAWRTGAFATSFAAFFLVEFGDKTQFVTAGYAALDDGWGFTAAGAALGIAIGCAPAVAMGTAWRAAAPLVAVRRTAGGLFLLVAAILAVNALQLI